MSTTETSYRMPMTIAETFKERAKERGVTQEDLAVVVGINRQSVYRKLNGITPMTLGEAYLMAEHLGLNLSKLLREHPGDA